jgi:PBP1b-binding outer membrane lipoprotein LpoB
MKKYISMFVLSAYFFSGCSNDYLDVDQTESISTKDIALFNNDQGATTLLLQSIISFRL